MNDPDAAKPDPPERQVVASVTRRRVRLFHEPSFRPSGGAPGLVVSDDTFVGAHDLSIDPAAARSDDGSDHKVEACELTVARGTDRRLQSLPLRNDISP